MAANTAVSARTSTVCVCDRIDETWQAAKTRTIKEPQDRSAEKKQSCHSKFFGNGDQAHAVSMLDGRSARLREGGPGEAINLKKEDQKQG